MVAYFSEKIQCIDYFYMATLAVADKTLVAEVGLSESTQTQADISM